MMPARAAAQRDAITAALVLIVLIVVGSAGLRTFDPALAGYCAATVVSCAATAYHVSLFWRRRPSAFYGRVLLGALRDPASFRRAIAGGARNVGAQTFIARRSRARWAAHMLLSWGTLGAFAITLPLVWGWISFAAVGEQEYQVRVFTFGVLTFDTAGILGWVVFNQLNLAAVAVVFGASYFLVVRLRQASRAFFHLAPLFLLLAVALSGLALPLAAELGAPGALRAAALVHQALVILMLVSLPYGKLVHLFIRPLHVAVEMLRAAQPARRSCAGCGVAFALAAQAEAVAGLLAERGFAFNGHQHLCPPCRRKRLALAQGATLEGRFRPDVAA